MNIHGQVSNNGWSYSLSSYQNFDPGSNRLSCTKYKDRHQFYKGVLSKEFKNGKGQMFMALQYVDYFSINEMFGPFVFVGDGSVKEMDGFSLGHNQYLPENTQMTFMDLRTGKMVTKDLNKDQHSNTLTATFKLFYIFDQTSDLVFRSRYERSDQEELPRYLGSVATVDQSAGFTYSDGKPYSGNIQYRTMHDCIAYESAFMNNAEYRKLFLPGLVTKFGADLNLSRRSSVSSTAAIVHEVCANPCSLYLNGNAFYNFNSSGMYYDGFETKAILYAYYDWKISNRWVSEGFIRAGANIINGEAANNLEDDTSNTRQSGFNLMEGKITEVKRFNPEWSAGFNIRYKLSQAISFNVEPIITSSHPTISDYCTQYLPSSDPIQTILVRGGINWSMKTFNLVAQLSYLSQDNKLERASFSHQLTKDVGERKADTYENVLLPINYGISSIGVTVDANWNPVKGFKLHGLLLLRSSKYENFMFSHTFSDGVVESRDFSGKYITAMPQVEFTLDPSYSINQWRFWLTARYLSREYINKTNSLYFAGRIETFAGIDFALNKHIKFKLNLINLLNQKGASGSIAAADLLEDTSMYTNYTMSGRFIRPFTIEAGINVNL